MTFPSLGRQVIRLSPQLLQLMGEAFAFGLTTAVSVGLAWWGGSWIDGKLGWGFPVASLVLMLGAIVGSFVRFIRQINRLGRTSSQRGPDREVDDRRADRRQGLSD